MHMKIRYARIIHDKLIYIYKLLSHFKMISSYPPIDTTDTLFTSFYRVLLTAQLPFGYSFSSFFYLFY